MGKAKETRHIRGIIIKKKKRKIIDMVEVYFKMS